MNTLPNDILGAKFGTKNRAELITRTKVIKSAIKDILYMARRYANGRQSYAPDLFNSAYDILRSQFGDDIDPKTHPNQTGELFHDITIETSKDHPYAVHGNEDSQSNRDLPLHKYWKGGNK